MDIKLYCDDTLDLDLDSIAENVSRIAPTVKVSTGRVLFRLEGSFVSLPKSYEELSRDIRDESVDSDWVLLFTRLPYDNNYFWIESASQSIISFAGWERLTAIPENNGAVFFLCSVLAQALDIGVRHDANTGCLNDFWMDKTGIDLGMRTGALCAVCLGDYGKRGNRDYAPLLDDIRRILTDVAAASRDERDICDYWPTRLSSQPRERTDGDTFDVFMCHSSDDKPFVREMNSRLRSAGVRTWFDEDELPPGRLWQELLEDQISQISTAAIFVGPSGLGPWQNAELRAFLSEFVRRRCPVMPVILADCPSVPALPLFLSQFTWVDFRRGTPDPFSQLIWGITGERPDAGQD